jgi:muramidase (phage lysozyme)
MAENQNRRNQQNQNPLAGFFSGMGAQGGFLGSIFAMIAALIGGNSGGFGGLFSNTSGNSRDNNSNERGLLQRGRDAVGDAFSRGRDVVTGVYQRGRNALLNLIGQHESGGDYNRVYGAGVKRMPLTDMTINQVLAWQRNYVNNGSASSAAGKYQIIQDTLRGLKRDMGLTGNEKFDAAMQDRMAEVLVQRRVQASTRNGQVDESLLIRNLSMEWASLPKDNSGLSYYHGDGLNQAHASHDSVRRAIDATFTDDGAVRYTSTARTGQTLSNTPRISSQLNRVSAGEDNAPQAVAAVAPAAPRQVALMSPSPSFA